MEWSIILSSSAIGTVIGAIIAWISSLLTNRAADRRQDKQLVHDREHEQFKAKHSLMTERGEEIYQQLFQDQTHLMLLNGNYINMLESAINDKLTEIKSALDFVDSFLKNDVPKLLHEGARLSLLQALYFPNIESDCKKYLQLRNSTMNGMLGNLTTIIPLLMAKQTQSLKPLLYQAKALNIELSECSNKILKSIVEEVRLSQNLPQSMPPQSKNQ